ncbi:ligand-effect modulator 3 family [Microdochium trichocladiopsis]|uniref:Ligand-effect modulator 3 family n=1 Tax=Microdochium trichocladiopsis TaxID=1682393 RepID=A0A9P9BME7_9PEZI|nr:ligand-effect modulator 3 family [Microdochium trichocladiopsis]KAH7026200.1 ligand-effect modulator 3 family [Microdochium trichocladiopsis]
MSDNSRPGSINETQEKKKTRRPANTAFRQQRLKAWQPILTPKTVIPLFFVIGLICAPIGGLLIYASSTVKEIQIDYTNCNAEAKEEQEPMPAGRLQAYMSNADQATALWSRETGVRHTYNGDYELQNLTRCTIQFHLPAEMHPPVYFYYRLGNFYQNHRRYVASFFDRQLKGDAVSAADVKGSTCTPLTGPNDNQQYYPCGLIANSLFNDTYSNFTLLNSNEGSQNETYDMTTRGIAWASDKDLYGPTQLTDYENVLPPPNWQIRYRDGKYSADAPPPNLQNDEHFMVWMRTAGLPTFSKLYAKNENDVMKIGDYSIAILDNFRATEYAGTKSIVITTLSPMGGRNTFLGILWLVVGGFCILLAVIFLITNLIKPRKLGDHTYLSWNNAPASAAAKGKGKAASGPSTAVATGREI